MIERGPIRFEIIKHFGVLSTAQTGWTKEFNIVKWNDREKFDIRDWAPGHERMSKGVTLYEHEMKQIYELCSEIFGEVPKEQPAEEKSEQTSDEERCEQAPAEDKCEEGPVEEKSEQTQVIQNLQTAHEQEEQLMADKVAEEEIPF